MVVLRNKCHHVRKRTSTSKTIWEEETKKNQQWNMGPIFFIRNFMVIYSGMLVDFYIKIRFNQAQVFTIIGLHFQ